MVSSVRFVSNYTHPSDNVVHPSNNFALVNNSVPSHQLLVPPVKNKMK